MVIGAAIDTVRPARAQAEIEEIVR